MLASLRLPILCSSRRLRPLVAGCGLAYALAIVTVWALLQLGDFHWLPTLLMFGPHWVWAVPVAIIIPMMLMTRLVVPGVLLSGLSSLLLGSIAGFCIPEAGVSTRLGAPLRVLSCNVQGLPKGSAKLRQLLERLDPDVIALQECYQGLQFEWLEGWHICRREQLMIASRHPLREVGFTKRRIAGEDREPVNVLQCVVRVEGTDVRICNVHLRTPRLGFEQLLELRRTAPAAMQSEIRYRRVESQIIEQGLRYVTAPLIVCGDFNMPEGSVIYQRYWSRFDNAFSLCGLGCGYTKRTALRGWSYGLRIDHVLTGGDLQARRCWVATDIGSDHLPVVADLTVSSTQVASARRRW